jgi:azurin
MQLRRVYRALLLTLLLPIAPVSGQSLVPSRTVTLVVGDDMKFAVTEIQAKPGEVLRVRLVATGTAPRSTMAHDFVLLNAGSNQIVFADAAARAVATDYIPPALKKEILASTTLIGNGESAEVVFKVPAKPGNYPYLCSFPGHFAAGARGKLIVK